MAQSLLTRARRLPWPQILGACASALFLIRTLGAGWSGGFPSGFPDSASYLEVADRGPLSLQFWFGERPLMLPLLSWLLAGNVLMIVLVQSLLAVAATWWAVIVLVRVVHSPLARALGIVLLVGVAVQSRFALWNTLLLSESLSITAGVAMIATWVWCAHEPSVRRIGWVAAATVAWALVRDSNVAIVVAIVIPGLLLVAWRSRERSPAIARSMRVTVGVLLVAALFAFVGQTASQRNRYPTLNVIGQRVLVSAELTDLYSSFGMPTDATVLERTGHSSFDDGFKTLTAPELSHLRAWAKSRGQLVHLWSLVREFPMLVADVWRDLPNSLANDFVAYDQFQVSQRLPHTLPLGLDGPRDHPSFLYWSLFAAVCLAAMVLTGTRRRCAVVLGVAYFAVLADLYLSWLGDSVEVHRHLVGALARLGVVFAFVLAMGVDAIIDLLSPAATSAAEIASVQEEGEGE